MRLPELAESEANYLADSFDFSGGQIDNIIRKKEITEVLQGVTICFDQIVCFCKEEILHHKFQSIGFKITKIIYMINLQSKYETFEPLLNNS